VGSGLIFAAVVIAWAAFLVPWALRRYDEATRTRSVDKVSKAMRLLGRSKVDAEEPEPVAAAPPLKPHATDSADRPVVEPPPRVSRAAARAAAERRRRVLLILVGVSALTGLVTAVGVIPVWSVAIPIALVLCFLALCRWQVRREDDAAWVRRRTGEEESASAAVALGDDPNDEPTVVFPAAAEARDSAKGRQAVEADADPVAAADLVESVSDAVSVTTSDGNALWDPLPVTLPTYVSKAKASRSVRTIDLGAPDTWTSGHVEGEQTELPSDQRSDSGADDTDAHRPAVGD
jgi:type IV secretory pathway VirB10-like protein